MTIADLPTKPGRGGRRPGAGRPRKDATPAAPSPTGTNPPAAPAAEGWTSANAEFAAQRARHERLKADQRALRLKVESQEYVPREMVRDVAGRQMVLLANGLRGIGDTLERRGLEPRWAQIVDAVVDQHLAAVAEGMRATYEKAQREIDAHERLSA